jgi:hypothetical protein
MWHYAEQKRGTQGVGRRDLIESDHLENLGVDGRIIFKMDLQEVGREEAWTGLLCLRIGTGSVRL